MFAKTIIESDLFLDMPISARLLYYDMGMRGDDDGFVNSPKRIMRVTGAHDDDLKVLIAKGFVIPFESGVIVITHWKSHNYIRNDRYKPTQYTEEKNLLIEDSNGHYLLTSGIPPDNQPTTKGLPDGSIGKVRLDKVSKGKVSKGKVSIDTSAEPLAKASTRRKNSKKSVKTEPDQGVEESAVITLLLNDKTEHPVLQSQIDKWIKLYPAVDVMQELRGMVGWIDANPQKRKTKSGIGKFINSWLAKAQNQGGRGYANPTADGGAKGVRNDNSGRSNGKDSAQPESYGTIL